jgi:hypothetical protein
MNREDNENIFLNHTLKYEESSFNQLEIISNKIEDEFTLHEHKHEFQPQLDLRNDYDFGDDKLSVSPLFLEKKRKSFNDYSLKRYFQKYRNK